MPRKHADTERIGGPGASHENRQHPEESKSTGRTKRITTAAPYPAVVASSMPTTRTIRQ
jgi:hypothetical protein